MCLRGAVSCHLPADSLFSSVVIKSTGNKEQKHDHLELFVAFTQSRITIVLSAATKLRSLWLSVTYSTV